MSGVQTEAACTIRVDNKKIEFDISSVTLAQYIDYHHSVEVRLRQVGKASGSKDIDDPAKYTGFLGKSIAVNIKVTSGVVDASRELEFIGIVTDVGLESSIDGLNTAIIKGYGPTIALDGARKYAFFENQSASEIIGAIVRNYPITVGNIESTKGTMKFTVQYHETDYAFITRLALEAGKYAFYNGKEFRLVKASGADIEELVWRETLGSFSYNLGTGVTDYHADVYNYEQSNTLTQDTKSLPAQSALGNLSKLSPDASKNIYSESSYSLRAKHVPDAQSLDDILQNEKSGSLGRMILCRGDSIVPKIMVGRCVKIKGMDKLDGSYWVTGVVHNFDESGKYANYFECLPLDIAAPRTLLEPKQITDLQSAVVVDNNDPDKMGRIKVKFPWSGNNTTLWIRFMTLHAGKSLGWFCLPEIGDEVLVGFERGDPDLPVALGALTNKNNSPHSDTNNPKNDVKMLLTKGGNQIYIMDESGKEQIKIAMKGGQNSIVMELSSPPKISIESQGDISLKGQNITIESQQKMVLKAGTDLNAESINMGLKASANSNIEGMMVNVKGTPIKLN